eukprot:gb/GECH01011781.1/.p1 GENE.gb/GECH01011781.1/~~gb/GECH01011781.1/.p1  ORF type:complete len:190 (+),score=33.57 gb/GECH01011781.1/:1-570(+)
MFLIDWFYNILNALGLYQKSGRLLFLGLDNAGKTTLLHRLKSDKLGTYQPTIHPNMEELVMGKIRFKTYDLGGHESARKLWEDYMTEVDAIVFLVDAAEPERLPYAREELNSLLTNENLANVPFLILGNKIDIYGAVSEEQLKAELGIQTTGKAKVDPKQIRPVEVFMCSVVQESGYGDGFRWLAQFLE